MSPSKLSLLLSVCAGLALAAIQLTGQSSTASLQLLSRDGRRAIPLSIVGGQELIGLDDLAGAFQLNVRDDGGAITVAYKGRRIALTPDQTVASVAGRLISLPSPPVRVGNRWLVPLDFIARALAPIYDTRLDLRRASHLLVIGDLRVPRVSVQVDPQTTSARVTIEISPALASTVTPQGTQRLLVRVDADALDVTLPVFQAGSIVQAIRSADTTIAIDLGPRYGSYRSTPQPFDGGSRLVLDLAGSQTDATPPPVAPLADQTPLVLGAGTAFRTIAIDAGHGGADTGVKGAAGVVEKDVTLAVARRLKNAVESRLGLHVVMTRDNDRLVPLADRTALANNSQADLLISLHANASFRPEVRGATVFVAAFSDADMSAERLTPQRLPVFGGGTRDIEVVPWNRAQIRHRDRSDVLAQSIIAALAGHVPTSTRAIEHAPLRVLESANMPAVIVDMGYLTNPDQEKALGTGELQAALAQGLVDAVTQFRDSAGVAR